jgi:hypothetical protein
VIIQNTGDELSTVRAGVKVTKGKWYYEVHSKSGGG